MSKCLACGKELPPKTEGKRERKFCDNKNKCKQLYHSKNQKEKKFKTIPIEQWEELQKKLAENNIPENKEKILKQRNTPNKAGKEAHNPLTEKEATKSTTLTPYQEMLKKKRGF